MNPHLRLHWPKKLHPGIPLYIVVGWGLVLIVQGTWNIVNWNQEVVGNFFDIGGPVRVINGFILIILVFSIMSYHRYDGEDDDDK